MKIIFETEGERKVHNFILQAKASLAGGTMFTMLMYLLFLKSNTPSFWEIAIPSFVLIISAVWLGLFLWANY